MRESRTAAQVRAGDVIDDRFTLTFLARWHRIMCTYQRAGRKKAVKVQSHRLDRRAKTSKLRDWNKDY